MENRTSPLVEQYQPAKALGTAAEMASFSARQRQAVRATRLLKTCGFKVDIHLMRPGCGRLLGMVGPYSVLRQRA